MNEDVFPIESWGFSDVMLNFSGVPKYQLIGGILIYTIHGSYKNGWLNHHSQQRPGLHEKSFGRFSFGGLRAFHFHGKVLFSYMNKSNIFVFSLRLFCYVYARHLLNGGFGAIAGGREPVKDKKF